MTSPSPTNDSPFMEPLPREYIDIARDQYGLSEHEARVVVAIAIAESRRFIVDHARLVMEMDGTGPKCSACGRVPGFQCKHLAISKETNRG